MPELHLLLAFAGGIFTTLCGAYVAHLLQSRAERHKRLREAHFHLYCRLREYDYYHFSLCTGRHPSMSSDEIKTNIRRLTDVLMESIRTSDDSPFTEHLIDVLLSDRFEMEQDRNLAAAKLLDDVERSVSPHVVAAVKRVYAKKRRVSAE